MPKCLRDAERLIADWNEGKARRMPLLFVPTIGAVPAARYWFLWVRNRGLPLCCACSRPKLAQSGHSLRRNEMSASGGVATVAGARPFPARLTDELIILGEVP
jgi:hypothetical protein